MHACMHACVVTSPTVRYSTKSGLQVLTSPYHVRLTSVTMPCPPVTSQQKNCDHPHSSWLFPLPVRLLQNVGIQQLLVLFEFHAAVGRCCMQHTLISTWHTVSNHLCTPSSEIGTFITQKPRHDSPSIVVSGPVITADGTAFPLPVRLLQNVGIQQLLQVVRGAV
jgi:hypothetical protein